MLPEIPARWPCHQGVGLCLCLAPGSIQASPAFPALPEPAVPPGSSSPFLWLFPAVSYFDPATCSRLFFLLSNIYFYFLFYQWRSRAAVSSVRWRMLCPVVSQLLSQIIADFSCQGLGMQLGNEVISSLRYDLNEIASYLVKQLKSSLLSPIFCQILKYISSCFP